MVPSIVSSTWCTINTAEHTKSGRQKKVRSRLRQGVSKVIKPLPGEARTQKHIDGKDFG